MKNRLSKKLLFFLAVFSLMTLLVFAASAKTVKQNGFVFDVKNGKATVVSYTGKAQKVVIPSKVSSSPVTEIAGECFWQVRTMTSVSIPDSVEKINHTAFNECTGLKSVTLPKKLTFLGDAAFWYCSSLEKVVFRSSLKSLGDNVFRGCDKVKVYVPYGSSTEKLVKAGGIAKPGYTYITKLTVPKSINLSVGETKALSPSVSPADGLLNGSLRFSSSDKKVAEISSRGVIKAVGCGTATITVKARDGSGKSTKCTVTVKPTAPLKLKQSASTLSSVSVKWNKASGATGYNVYRYDSAKKAWKLVSYTTKTKYTFKSLDAGEKLQLRVRSVFKSGKVSILGGKADITVSSASVAAVTGLKQSSATLSSVTAKWNAVSGASKYSIQKYNASKKKWETLTETAKTSCTVTGLSAAESVKLRVRTVFAQGKKTYYSKNVSITLTAASPAAVSNLKKSASTLSSATISWSANKNAVKYRVYKYDAAKKKWVTASESAKTSYTVSGLLPSESVKLRVAGIFKNGSKTVLGKTKDITVSASDVPSVKSTKLLSCSNGTLSFNWTACMGVDGYNIYGYDAEAKKYTFKGTVKGTSYSVSSLKTKTKYSFAVKAFVTVSGTKYESKSFSPLLSVYTPLTAVKDFKAGEDSVTRTTISLFWSACDGAEGYILEFRKNGSENWESLSIGADKTEFTCTELEAATDYQFRLRAFFRTEDSEIHSDYTDVLTVSTYALPETKTEAIDSFAEALKNTARQKDFTLFKTAKSSDRQFLPDEEKFSAVLSAVDSADRGFYRFKDKADASSGKKVEELLPSLGEREFTAEEAESYVADFKQDGSSGLYITLEIPEGSDLSEAFMPDVKTAGRLGGLNVTEVSCKKLVIEAKIHDGKLDFITATVSFTATGLENSTGRTFSLGETLERGFVFKWA